MHVAHQFAIDHESDFKEWHRDSNTIVILAANSDTIETLRQRAIDAKIPTSSFIDDDLGSSVTALCLGPGNKAKKLCFGLPLALKEAA